LNAMGDFHRLRHPLTGYVRDLGIEPSMPEGHGFTGRFPALGNAALENYLAINPLARLRARC